MCRDAGSAADSSARNLGSRRSCGLRGEIIRPSVYDHDAPNNFADPKAVGIRDFQTAAAGRRRDGDAGGFRDCSAPRRPQTDLRRFLRSCSPHGCEGQRFPVLKHGRMEDGIPLPSQAPPSPSAETERCRAALGVPGCRKSVRQRSVCLYNNPYSIPPRHYYAFTGKNGTAAVKFPAYPTVCRSSRCAPAQR